MSLPASQQIGSRDLSGIRWSAHRSALHFFFERVFLMVRLLALAFTVLLTAQAAPAFGQVITVSGQLSGGNFVNVVCSVGADGQISGTGVLYGVNPSNGYTYKYPFTVTKGATTSGSSSCMGPLVGAGYPVTLVTSVPSGPMSFSYVVAGKTYTLTGSGTVSVN